MIDGIINVYKEKGYTSHDVVAKMRGILKQKKIGHTGTLDPDATGVLPVCLGKGTKLCDLLTDQNKTYKATLLLGIETDTQDITGAVLESREVTVTSKMVEKTIMDFLGAYEQIPPMYSAIKQNGKKLYELARAGQIVERKSRSVVIHEIIIDQINLPRVEFTVTCSKGTYIRTLCHDIGEQLGCKGCMESLERTQTGRFCKAESLTLGEIEQLKDEGKLEDYIIPIDQMFADYTEAKVQKKFHIFAHNGNAIEKDYFYQGDELPCDKPIRVYDEEGCFIGIYQYDSKKNKFQLRKMFFGGN